MLKGGYIRI